MIEFIDIMPRYVCVMSDGSTPKHKYPGEKGNQMTWTKNWLTATCLRLIHNESKKSKPILGFNNTGTNLRLLGADFDTIPPELNIQENTPEAKKYWNDFELKCLYYYGTQAVVARSCSNKVKVIFEIELPWKMQFNKEEQIMGLKQVLLPRHFDLCDTSANSTNLTYLTPSILLALQKVKYLTPIKLELTKEYLKTVCQEPVLKQCFIANSNSTSFTSTMDSIVKIETKDLTLSNYIVNTYPIAEPLTSVLEDWDTTGNRTMFLNKIVAMWGLLSKAGFQISIKKMAAECKVSMDSISRYIRFFIRIGILDCINPNYAKGVRAKTYKASGVLINAITNQKELVEEARQSKTYFKGILPVAIKDGSWDATLWAVHYAFKTAKEFLAYVTEIPGYFKKDRQKKVERIIERGFKSLC